MQKSVLEIAANFYQCSSIFVAVQPERSTKRPSHVCFTINIPEIHNPLVQDSVAI